MAELLDRPTAVDLHDDGMRLIATGEVGLGDLVPRAQYVSEHNPLLIAQAIAIKAMRRTIRETNERRFG